MATLAPPAIVRDVQDRAAYFAPSGEDGGQLFEMFQRVVRDRRGSQSFSMPYRVESAKNVVAHVIDLPQRSILGDWRQAKVRVAAIAEQHGKDLGAMLEKAAVHFNKNAVQPLDENVSDEALDRVIEHDDDALSR